MKEFIESINRYTPISNEEALTKDRFQNFILENPDCFHRSNLKGHITASAFVIDPENQQILLIHHKKLDKWLQPGGHCDGDEDTLAVAIKEVYEETGVLIEPNNQKIVDLDIHTIPERKGIPEHEHFDVRYVFYSNSEIALVQNHETVDLKWVNFDKIEAYTQEESILRILRKL